MSPADRQYKDVQSTKTKVAQLTRNTQIYYGLGLPAMHYVTSMVQ